MSEDGAAEAAASQASWNPALRPNTDKVEEHVAEITSNDDSSKTLGAAAADDQEETTALSQDESIAPVTKNPQTNRPVSRHFAQSASIHQVPESDDVDSGQDQEEDPFQSIPTPHLKYTNSFPVVPPSQNLASAADLPEPLPRSQAEDIVAENEAERTPKLDHDMVNGESGAAGNIDWGDAGEDEEFLGGVTGGHDEGVITETTDSRYEEGIPLVPNGEHQDHAESKDLDWGDAAGEDDFFANSPQTSEDPFNPKPLDRKSTEQVLGSMKYPVRTDSQDEIGSPAQDSGVDLGLTSSTKQPAASEAETKEPDLAAAWSQAFDDEDLLAEDNTVDPSAFFEDDGEGFLEDMEGASLNAKNHTLSQQSSYAPNGASQPSVRAAPVRPTIGQQSIQEPTRAQSFVDKAKGGYESPYDLPMDLRPKRQPAPRQSPALSQKSPQMPPPPQSPYAPAGQQQAPPTTRPSTQGAKPSAFFEELPIQSRPARPPSSARFTPASPPVGPPVGPPTVGQGPPRPNAPSNPPNPAFDHGLVMPNRTLSFGEDANRPAAPSSPAPPKTTSRYSPVQNNVASSQVSPPPPASGRYSSGPASGPPARTSSASFTAPFQPRTSSPLARKTSISENNIAQAQDRSLTQTPPQLTPSNQSGKFQSPEKVQRKVSVQSPPSYQTGTVVRHHRAPSLIKQYVSPTDDRAQDPLERWKGGPIFKFGAAGVLSSFPVETPRFSVGSTQPLYQVNPGEIKIRSAKTVAIADPSILTFPGPLKAKGKKKDLIVWLSKRVQVLQEGLLSHEASSMSELARQRQEDRLILLQVLSVLIEHDGNLEASPSAIAALRNVLSPAAPNADPQAGAANYGSEVPTGITRSGVVPPSRSTDVEAVEEVRSHLLKGDREKAAWYAVDKNLWGHAMLIASTLQGETWKQVVHEFVKNEVKPCGNNTEALSALYDVFSGNWDESVDQLVPAAARSGFQMINKTGSSSIQDALAGLSKWQETLALIVSNRTNGDAKAIISLGELLASYGRSEAAHTCYIVARLPGLLTGIDDPAAHAVLLGANHRQRALDIHKDVDALLITEAYEFATNILASGQSPQPMQYLVPYKLQHALVLADAGRREDAQAYCEVITASIKTNKMSPYLHPQLLLTLDDLVNRLSQAPKESSKSWLGNPKMGDVSNSLLNRFNKFVSGDDGDAASTASGPVAESGPFGGIAGEPISISRTGSPSLSAGGFGAQHAFTPAVQAPGASSRYAPAAPSYSSSPANSYTASQHRDSSGSLPRMSPDHFRRMPPSSYQAAGAYTPTSGLAGAPRSYSPETSKSVPPAVAPSHHQSLDALTAISDSSRPGTSDGPFPPGPPQARRISYEPLSVPKPAFRDRNSSAYQPRSSGLESRSSSYAARSSSYAPRSYAPSPAASERVPDDASRQSSGSYIPQAPLMESAEQNEGSVSGADVNTPLPPPASDASPAIQAESKEDEVQPNSEAPISFGGYDPNPSYGYQPSPSVPDSSQIATEGDATSAEPSIPSYGQSYDPPTGENGVDNSGSSYEPPSFGGGYEPPSAGYQPYMPDSEYSPEESKPKKKGMMDLSDDEDNLAAKTAAMKKEEKARKDREAEDAFRRAAEEDAKRDQQNKAGNRSSWFGGWLGSKKRDSSSPEPTVYRAKLGEESSFVYDETLKQWVNKKAGADAAPVEKKAKPPPPRGGPPSRSSSLGPPMGGPPRSVPPSAVAGLGLGISGTPPSRTQSPLVNMTSAADVSAAAAAAAAGGVTSEPKANLPPMAGNGATPPPMRSTSGTSAAGSLDDILGGPPGGGRKTGAAKKGKKAGRYVDVMAK